MHKTLAAFGMALLMIGCTTTITARNDYIVDERTITDHHQASQAIKDAANTSLSARTPATQPSARVIRTFAPKMPREAIERDIAGSVRVLLLVDKAGKVSEVRVLKSPHALLSEAVVEAMRQWVFAPLIVNGSPQAFSIQQTFEFHVKD